MSVHFGTVAAVAKNINCQPLCSLGQTSHSFQGMLYLTERRKRLISAAKGADLASWKATMEMTHIANTPILKLRKAPQPPRAYPGAAPDSYRAKRPPLVTPQPSDQELGPGDRVEGLGNFGKPTGEIGTVERSNEEDAVVKWDHDGRTRLHQPSLKKI